MNDPFDNLGNHQSVSHRACTTLHSNPLGFWLHHILSSTGVFCFSCGGGWMCLFVPGLENGSRSGIFLFSVSFCFIMCLKLDLIVILILISPLIIDIEHLPMCFSAICISSLEKYLCKSFAHFNIDLLFSSY